MHMSGCKLWDLNCNYNNNNIYLKSNIQKSSIDYNYVTDFKVAWRKIKRRKWRLLNRAHISNYDSLIVRTVAFPVQVAYSPLRIQCPMSILTSGLETWPWGPVGCGRSLHDRVSRGPACKPSPRAKLESDRY